MSDAIEKDEVPESVTVMREAAKIRTNKVLSFPRNLGRDLDALREKGCEVSYERGKAGGLTEEFEDVKVSGPADVVEPFWNKIEQDLGMKILTA